MLTTPRIILTPGEPAGIGPDIVSMIAQETWPCELIAITDPVLLSDQLHLIDADLTKAPEPHQAGRLKIIPLSLGDLPTPGQLNIKNAAYVIQMLEKAADLCQSKVAQAVVTGPVHKGILNQAGIPFSGHTEFFAAHCHVAQTVMLFVVNQLKVALATTHLPLCDVASAITPSLLENVLRILKTDLQRFFRIDTPRIAVCGLNPHAGEQGHLGREEIDVIEPVLTQLRQQGYQLEGPLSADTLFTPKHLANVDAVLAMFHDQALPLVKYIGFGHAVNVTLGLPFIRTSVDHGTALDVAGTGKADAGSLRAAITLAHQLASL